MNTLGKSAWLLQFIGTPSAFVRATIYRLFRHAPKAMRPTLGVDIPAIALLFLFISGCGFFPEASFSLAPDSRLPKWFSPPPQTSRSQLTVKMDYYVKPWGRTATFKLIGANNQVLAKVTGSEAGVQPQALDAHQSSSPNGYPAYCAGARFLMKV